MRAELRVNAPKAVQILLCTVDMSLSVVADRRRGGAGRANTGSSDLSEPSRLKFPA